jgi:hypothetical protein
MAHEYDFECLEEPAAKRGRFGAGAGAEAVQEYEDAWLEMHEGLGWGDGFGDEEVVMFRNDILPYTDTVPAHIAHQTSEIVSVIDSTVVRTKIENLNTEFVAALVDLIVARGRSVRHILVNSHADHTGEWLESSIDLHGEGGQVVSGPSAQVLETIPERKLNARTLLIDELDNKSLQEKVVAVGGMVVVVVLIGPE